MLASLVPLLGASLLPWFVIAAGAGLFFLGWLYGRLAGRQREAGRALVAQMDATQALGAHLQTTERAFQETEARVVPKLGEVDRLRATLEDQTPKVEEARAALLGISTRISSLEDRLAETSRQSLEAREAAKAAGERAGRGALTGLSETLMGHKAEAESMLAEMAQRMARLEERLDAGASAGGGSTGSGREAASAISSSFAASRPPASASSTSGGAPMRRADGATPRADGSSPTPVASASTTVRKGPATSSKATAAALSRDEITTTAIATADEDAEESEGGAGWIFLVLAIMLALAAVANAVGS